MKTKINHKRILVISFLLFCIFVYSSDYLMLDLPEQYLRKFYEKSNVNLWARYLKMINVFFKLVDDVNIFYFKENLLDETFQIIDLKLSSNDINHFENISIIAQNKLYLPSEINQWRDSKISYLEETYDVKIKLHGDMYNHWNSRLKSYKIKTSKIKYIDQLKNFNLIIFEDRWLIGIITKYLASDFNLFNIRDNLVVLKINGVVQGLYYLQEKLDNTFLENNQCSNCVVVKITDNFLEDHPHYNDPHGIYIAAGHYTPFDYEISNLDMDNETIAPNKINNVIDNLFTVIKSKNYSTVSSFFDLDSLSSFEALRLLLGSNHLITGDNLKLVYSQTNNKFYVIPINEGLEQIRLNKGGFENYLTYHGGYPVELVDYWTKNEQLRYLKYKKAYDYIKNNHVIDKVFELNSKIIPYAKSYKTNEYSRRYIEKKLDSSLEILNSNFNLIKENLEYAKVYVNARLNKNILELELIPDTTSFIGVNNLLVSLNNQYVGNIKLFDGETFVSELNILDASNIIDLTSLFEELKFTSNLDDDMNPEIKRYFLNIKFDHNVYVLGINFNFINLISNELIKSEDLYLNLADQNDFIEGKYFNKNEFLNKYGDIGFIFINNKIILEGEHFIYDDVIIPEGFVLNINSGTKINIAPDKSFISYSPIEISGLENNPVIIQAIDETKPFGVFGVVGNDNELVDINWLKLSGGSEKWINGIFFSGGLSIYHINVNMSNSEIFNNHADDGLNIKYSTINLENNIFRDNFADQVDLDFCEGFIKNSKFKDSGFDENGDGLDLSGSLIIIKNNLFENFKDKGVSVGEKTNIYAYENIFKNNFNGVAVKDLSNIYLVNNQFINNTNDINAYQKKPLFGGGYFYLYKNLFSSVQNQFLLDKKSKQFNLNLNENRSIILDQFLNLKDINGLFNFLDGVESIENIT